MWTKKTVFQTKLAFPSTVSKDTFAINTITSNNHDELLVITMIQQLLGNSVLWAKFSTMGQTFPIRSIIIHFSDKLQHRALVMKN